MTFPNGGKRDEGHPSRQVGRGMYPADPTWDIPAAAHLTQEQHDRMMSTDIGHLNENGKFDRSSVHGIKSDPVARNTYRGRQVIHNDRVFSDMMYYQD